LPDDITSLDDRALMSLMVRLTRWLEYQGVRLARAKVVEQELDYQISQRSAIIMLQNWGGTREDRVAIAKAQVETDKQIERLRQDHGQSYAYRKLLENLYDATERKTSTVSRELTRRGHFAPHERRSDRWGGA
jgi:hypothetical protein